MTPEQHIAAHEAAGRRFETGGAGSFVREDGTGDAVVCVHGVPSSSFLYRKLLAELAGRGLRGIAFDLPGLGLAERPADFDYTFTGLGQWCAQATEALGLDRFHLVIHDIGGPIGLELASRQPERVASLTILNTVVVGLEGFRKPWVMRPFQWRGVGEAYLATMTRFAFTRLMYWLGVNDKRLCTPAEAGAYVDLLKRDDGGRAFLRIMRRFETSREKENLYVGTVRDLKVPKQIIWGAGDKALPLARFGRPTQEACAVEALHTLPSKHFLQEDQAPALATLIAALARTTTATTRE